VLRAFVVNAIFSLNYRRLKSCPGWGKQENNPQHKEFSHGE
jgi:hypothetical protein